MSTLVFESHHSLDHVTPPGHPERVDRIKAVTTALDQMDGIERRAAPPASLDDVMRAHPETHINTIRRAIPEEGQVALDADTFVSPGSFTAALHAVGGNVAAVAALAAGDAANAFVATRPPGHHAERTTPMGFCLFGNAAIAAKCALDIHGFTRVAVIDFDVHHGNGTQDILWKEPRIRFASTHQMPLYPGTGARSETGAHGNILNVPLDPGTGGSAMRLVYEREVLPALDAFAPDFVVVSAGFDAHAADPLANLNWTDADFAWVTERICDLADAHADGRVVSTLEGGYDLAALASGVTAHVTVLRERGQ